MYASSQLLFTVFSSSIFLNIFLKADISLKSGSSNFENSSDKYSFSLVERLIFLSALVDSSPDTIDFDLGSVNQTVVPCPSSDSIPISPQCFSIAILQKVSPIPVEYFTFFPD